MDSPATSTLAVFGSALLGCTLSPRQEEVLLELLGSRPAQERIGLGVLLALLDRMTLAARPRRRFRNLPREAQAMWLERWFGAFPSVMAQALAGLRSLTALAVYSDRQNWARIGYDGPWLGRRQITVFPELVPSASAPPSADLRADVCIIGSGAGGASAAARLAERGLRVIVLERGPRITAGDYTQLELDMLPLLYAERGLAGTANQAITIMHGRGLGGSTLHNTGLVVEPPAGVIERWRTEHGFDVPNEILSEQVRRVTRALCAVPIPADQLNAANQAFRTGASALGWQHFIAQHNRLECSGCGYCMLGCAYNRKVNAAGAFLQSAVRDGAMLLSDTRVEHFAGSPDRFVVHARAHSGSSLRVQVRRVIVAAGALETPLLLRRSGVKGSAIGRNLRLHPAPVVFARFDERIEAWRGLPQAVVINHFARFEKTGRGGFLLLPNAGTAPALTAAILPGLGATHHALMSAYPHCCSGAVLLHDETEGSVRGRARPIVRYWPDEGDRAELLGGIRALSELFLAAGAREVYLPFERGLGRRAHDLDGALRNARIQPHRLPITSVHPQGTCALGSDRKRSGVRPNGELWQTPGVFVADASIFPTSIGVPPQVSIMALAGVVADHVAGELA